MIFLHHIDCIVIGGDWCRFFGAAEQIGRMADQGIGAPQIVTSVIVLILLNCVCYGFQGRYYSVLIANKGSASWRNLSFIYKNYAARFAIAQRIF